MGRGVFGGIMPSGATLMGAALWAAACSATAPQGQPSPQAAAPGVPLVAAATAGETGTLMGADDLERLKTLTDRRAGLAEESTYRIGPDDLLDIRIPDLTDARSYGDGAQSPGGTGVVAGAPTFHQGERVDDSGEITIPHVGVVRAAGLTAAQLEKEIAGRLVSSGILRRPQVAVMIAEYRSRVVAVVGSVERPGTYPLTRPGATVSDMIWAAGGPGQGAGRMVLFSPAPEAVRVASSTKATAHADVQSDAGPGMLPPGARPIRIDLQALLRAPDVGGGLNPQVRPGDVISLAQAGSVLVEGWVDKPGSYPVTPGLTLSGAIVAAGGGVYAADLETVSVRRTLAPGEQRTIPADLTAISEGREPDLPILDGDVVNVPVHSTKVVPYGIWKAGRELIHVGASIPIF